jgi:phospholipid/cholesterol/gamma-HCH transport system permease protein
MSAPARALESLGEISQFSARVAGRVASGRVLAFFGEALRQAGILIMSSTRCRCSASTPSRTSSCPASSR